MQFAKISKKTAKGEYTATVGLCLKGIHILPPKKRELYKDFAIMMLGRQMDVVQSLHELERDYALGLRYLFDPREPYVIKVYYLIQVINSKKSEAVSQVEDLGNYLLHLLRINNRLHEFSPVGEIDQL